MSPLSINQVNGRDNNESMCQLKVGFCGKVMMNYITIYPGVDNFFEHPQFGKI